MAKTVLFLNGLDVEVLMKSKLYSTMDRVRGPIEKIHYGHNRHNNFFGF